MKNITIILIFLIAFAACQTEPNKIKVDFETIDLHLDNSFRGISVVNESTVWISGTKGTIVKSSASGDWEVMQIEGAESLDFRDVAAFDENTALAMNAGFPGVIYKTQNGGLDWSIVYNNQDSAIFLDGMKFWDENRGIAFGDPIDGHMVIISTKDAGETWIQTPSENIPEKLEIEGGFAASGSSIVVQEGGYAWVGMGGTKARVFFTSDYGMSWDVVETPILSGGNMKGIYSMAFKDAKDGIAVGGEYKNENPPQSRAYTNDGGKSWKLGVGVDQYRSEAVHLFDDIYLATGLTGTDITYNGGKNWEPISEIKLHGMQYVADKKVGYGMGRNGLIVKFKVSKLIE